MMVTGGMLDVFSAMLLPTMPASSDRPCMAAAPLARTPA